MKIGFMVNDTKTEEAGHMAFYRINFDNVEMATL